LSGLKFKKGTAARIIFLSAVLLLVVLASSCIQGLYPVGWSGGAVSGDTLYVGSQEGKLVAINLTNESRRWSTELTAPRTGFNFGCIGPGGGAPSGVAIYGTPALSGDLVYLAGYNGKIYAFTADSLEVRWLYPREGYLEPVVSAPVVSQGKVFIGVGDGKIYALDAATGDKLWEFATGDNVWSTPVIEGDTLFVGSFDHNLYALDINNGTEKWRFQTEGAITASPLVREGNVYIGSFDRNLYALDINSGAEKWRFAAENWFWAQAIAVDGTVYAGNQDSKVYALDAASGTKQAEFNLDSPAASVPVQVGNNVVFASREGILYRINTEGNTMTRLADIGTEVLGPLTANEGIIYIHTQDLTLHRVNAETGAVMMSVSLESEE